MEKNATRKQKELEENLQGLDILIFLFNVKALIPFRFQLINWKGVTTFVLVTASSHVPGQERIGTSGHQHKGPHLRFKAVGKL